MNSIKRLFFNTAVVLCVVAVSSLGCVISGQTLTPKDRIPADTPTDVRQAIEQLYNSYPTTLSTAARTLGAMKERAAPAIPFLLGLLHDDTTLEVRRYQVGRKPELVYLPSPGEEAARALGKIGPPGLRALIAALKTGSPRRSEWQADIVRRNAAAGLQALGDKQALRPLIEVLEDRQTSASVRSRLVIALGSLGDPSAAEALINALRDPDPSVRQYAANAFRDMKDPRAIRPLAEAMKDQDKDVRHEASMALRYTPGEDIIGLLSELLKSERPEVRKEALDALGERGNWLAEDASLIALAAIMTDPNQENRVEAAQLLYKMWANHTGSFRTMRDKATIASLIASLKDDNMIVASVAARLLGSIKDRSTVPALISALKENPHGAEYHNGYVPVAAALALAKINDLSAVEPLIAALDGCAGCESWGEVTTALQQLTGNSNIGANSAAWKLWWTRNKRRVLATHAKPA